MKQKTLKERMAVKFSLGGASFTIGVILFALSVCGLLLYIITTVLISTTDIFYDDTTSIGMILLISGIAAFLLFGFLSHCLFRYLSETEKTKAVKVFSGITVVQYFLLIYTVVFIIGILVTMVTTLIAGITGNLGDSNKSSKSTLTVTDANGSKRELTPIDKVCIDGKWYYAYRDDIGQEWISTDQKTVYKRPI